ncbi:cytochrome c biogenesis protein ResB [Actinoallomurus rhizosphaericola]|uniref:cytochrome c biogenesis protein ResB n=1 Tax=Actinoallomurus rhizosphaericola TaxID=2952536 RepID=UPI0020907225|nr:cytochrome c biogenesis protein ResB [Actinoallomurus rhizosphaericola]MCO5994522.1 cytochrome c biogenesis protein ResB [Actinoallomurus rhizosphaericola]
MSVDAPEAQAAPQAPRERPAGIGVLGWLRWGWRQLTSMRTALVLLFLVALGTVPGSFLPQRGLAPEKVTTFFQQHKTLAPVLDKLSLFDVFAAPWFAAIYILLFVSLAGCVLPRAKHHLVQLRSRPPKAPRNLGRLPEAASYETDAAPDEVLAEARTILKDRRFRVDAYDDAVAAEKGYLRETGNLVFHVALLVLLFAVGSGAAFGYKGNVLVTEGEGFSNTLASYDAFKGGRSFTASKLPPFTVWLDSFSASYLPSGPNRGQPTNFSAKIRYQNGLKSAVKSYDLKVNHPLNVDGARVYLLGHGYAPRFTVKDGKGQVAFQGAVPFLPTNEATYASEGVIKVPDAQPDQLGFIGLFWPTAVPNQQGKVVSAFPAAWNPQVALFAFKGDLGLSNGAPQSVYRLETAKLKPLLMGNKVKPLAVGQTLQLPSGAGSVTFDGYRQYVTIQVNHDPGRVPALAAGIVAIMGIVTSFLVRRRRVWVRAKAAEGGRTVVQVGGLTLGGATPDFQAIVERLKTAAPEEPRSTAPDEPPNTDEE